MEEKEEVDEETVRREQIEKDVELNQWLIDWEGSKTRSKGQERSNLVASLGKPGSSTTKKRGPVSNNKSGKTKKPRLQPLDSNWGEGESPAPLGSF